MDKETVSCRGRFWIFLNNLEGKLITYLFFLCSCSRTMDNVKYEYFCMEKGFLKPWITHVPIQSPNTPKVWLVMCAPRP